MKPPRRTTKKAKPRILVVVSDTHCGSDVGLMCEGAKLKNGNVVGIGENLVQQWLWLLWQDAIARVAEIIDGDNASLIANGDLIEGCHHRSTEVIAATIEEHTGIAIECMKPLRALCQDFFVVRGTECHTHNMETLIAHQMGAVDGVARDKWLTRIAGTLVDSTHHVGTAGRVWTEASAVGAAMNNARLNYMKNDHEVPKIFNRAHRHNFGMVSDGEGMIAVTGPWQGLTRYGHKVVPDAICSPSINVFDWRGVPDNELPIFRQIKFKPPQQKIYES